MTSERFTFAGADGQPLDGRLEAPAGEAVGTALFAHCFTCTKQSLAATRLADRLVERGWRVLRFDFTGLGDSGGDFATAGFETNIADLVAASDALRAAGHLPRLLVGHSLGGAAMIAAAEQIPEARALATIGSPFDVEHMLHRFGDGDVERIEADGAADVTIGGRPYRVAKPFIDQARGQPQGERLNRLGKAYLVLHSPSDETVEIAQAKELFDHARHPKSFVALDGADHLLTVEGSAAWAADIIAAWGARYAR